MIKLRERPEPHYNTASRLVDHSKGHEAHTKVGKRTTIVVESYNIRILQNPTIERIFGCDKDNRHAINKVARHTPKLTNCLKREIAL